MHLTDYRPGRQRTVLAHTRYGWRGGWLVAWFRDHDLGGQWVGQVQYPSGPPALSRRTDFIASSRIKDAEACTGCPVYRSRWVWASRDGVTVAQCHSLRLAPSTPCMCYACGRAR